MIVVLYVLSTSLASVYIMHQRPRITRVLTKYAGGEESLSGSPSLVESSMYAAVVRTGP